MNLLISDARQLNLTENRQVGIGPVRDRLPTTGKHARNGETRHARQETAVDGDERASAGERRMLPLVRGPALLLRATGIVLLPGACAEPGDRRSRRLSAGTAGTAAGVGAVGVSVPI